MPLIRKGFLLKNRGDRKMEENELSRVHGKTPAEMEVEIVMTVTFDDLPQNRFLAVI